MGGKVGRNEQCPCGSGKKYKKCCLNSKTKKEDENQYLTPPSIYQLLIHKFLEENHLDLEKEKSRLEKQIFTTTITSTQNADDFLVKYIECCENEIKGIVSKYNIYDLLYWSRRFGPKNIFNVSVLSVMIYREIQALAIYRYGKHESKVMEDGAGMALPKIIEEYNNLDYEKGAQKILSESLPSELVDQLSDVVRVEILSFIFLRGTQLYRMINKGGQIIINTISKEIDLYTNEELGYLLDLYDDRLIKTNTFSMTGSYVKVNEFSNSNNEIAIFPFFNLNVDHKEKFKLFIPDNKAFEKVKSQEDDEIFIIPNYMVGFMNLKKIYEYLLIFKEEFETYYGFTLKNFIVFLGCLGFKFINDLSISLSFQFSLFNRGYIVADYDIKKFLEQDIAVYAPEIIKNLFDEQISDYDFETAKILERFLLKKSNQQEINLWTRGPKKIFYQISENHMVLDYVFISDIVQFITKEITGVDGEVGNRRARYFEDSIENEVVKIYGEKTWLCKKTISCKSGKREIDASFIIQDVLFLVEAKAVNVSFGYDKGDKKALDFRINKLKSALKEVEDKANFILQNRTELQHEIPENVKYICPIAISPYPEYIWEKSDDLFISINQNLPRIITIDDLNDISKVDLKELKKLNWVIKLM